jgi:hypothetical protein
MERYRVSLFFGSRKPAKRKANVVDRQLVRRSTMTGSLPATGGADAPYRSLVSEDPIAPFHEATT